MNAQGAHAIVTRDGEGRVRKRLHASTGDARAHLEREYHYLARLSEALAGQPHLACPTPLSIERDERTLVMTHCPGTPLDALLADPESPFDAHAEHLAGQMAVALTAYVHAFREPYYSLSAANLVFDADTGRLYLLDFTTGRTFPGVDERGAALEVSLGCLLARSIHHTVGPRSVWHRFLLKRYSQLLSNVLDHVPGRLDDAVMLHIAHQARTALTARTAIDTLAGPAWQLRQAWHHGPGRALFHHRVRSLVTRSSPRQPGPTP